MSLFNLQSVRPESEEVCLDWAGEFRGSICIRIKVVNTSVKFCVRGGARRLGTFDECFEVFSSCYTLADVDIGKLKICFSDIEAVGGLPRCFQIKIIFDPVFGKEITLAKDRFCLLAILGKQMGKFVFSVNQGAGDDELVMMIAVDKSS